MGTRSLERAIQNPQELVDNVALTDVRQTVATGPVDSDGRADFLEEGTGLQVISKGVTESISLQLTFGDGFLNGSRKDFNTSRSDSFSFDDLPDDEDNVYLYLEWDGSTLSTGHSALAPEYSLAKPSSPSTGQYWYPTDHRSRGERWDGSAWEPVYRIYVGECATSGGSVVDVRSYAYQGWDRRELGQASNDAVFTFAHNIGVNNATLISIDAYARTRLTVNGWPEGSTINLIGLPTAAPGRNYFSGHRTPNVFRFNTADNFLTRDGETAEASNWSNFDLIFAARRAF